MSKKRVTKKPTGGELAKVEAERAREPQTLRRLKRQQRAIVDTARAVTRAVRRADVARVAAARELCEGSGWGVFGLEQWDQSVRELQAAAETIKRLDDELREAYQRISDIERDVLDRNELANEAPMPAKMDA